MADDSLFVFLPRVEATKLALGMYLGERCLFCRKAFETLDDLEASVWTGYHTVDGVVSRISHLACWVAAGSPRSQEELSRHA